MNINSEQLCIIFTPSLASILWNAKQSKGEPLSEEEVLQIRDKSITMTVSISIAQELAESRGYTDINPDNAWEEWQDLRQELDRLEN